MGLDILHEVHEEHTLLNQQIRGSPQSQADFTSPTIQLSWCWNTMVLESENQHGIAKDCVF